MGEKTAGVGHFTIPTSPAIGTTVAQNASANTYTAAYVQLSAAVPAAIFITGIYVQLAAGTNVPTYMSVQLATGAAASEAIVGQHNVQFGPTSGVAATAWGMYKPICPPIAVANGVRVAAKTASSVASALSWAVTLECINQANVADDGVAQSANVTQWNGLAVAVPATAGIPDVNVKNINNVAAATPGASGGILISGSNAGTTTLGALTVTGATTHTGNVVLSDGLTISAPSTGNRAGLDIAGNGTGAALKLVAGATGVGFSVAGGGTSGDGIKVTTTSGHGLNLAPVGTSMHGLFATGGNGGTSDGIKAAAGTGGVDLRAAITGNVTGNLSGSVGSVTGAVGSVTGAVGSVTGAVGSVTGAVGSVTGLTASNLDATVSSRLAAASYTAPLSAGATANAVWDELTASHAGIGSAGLAVATAALNTSLSAAGVRTAVGLASANLDTQLSAIKTDTAAVKVQTDKLVFTVANKLDVNLLVVNGVTVGGAGTAGSPWGPA